MIIFPNAKINLGLNIIEKRTDGFHTIQSVLYPTGLCDALEIAANEGREEILFTSTGIPIPGDPSTNLCIKAYHLIKKDYVLPRIRIHLHKHIPIGAGLGGGSSDAAYFMKLLNQQFEIGLSWGELHNYAKQLGSDCSFFISNRPAYAEGKGDEYESVSLDLSGNHLVIVYPGIHISTAEAYSGVTPKTPSRSLESDITNIHLSEWKDCIHNDFEDSLFMKYPAIAKLKNDLYESGAAYASLSGSGSAVYGIFTSEPFIEDKFPGFFVWKGPM